SARLARSSPSHALRPSTTKTFAEASISASLRAAAVAGKAEALGFVGRERVRGSWIALAALTWTIPSGDWR
ncbi:MAG TPA: hypothetical protein VE820_00385, partial [Sphingomicrobium sp.]|nr:hypothetical protein [Sphingomicrobium sp.]